NWANGLADAIGRPRGSGVTHPLCARLGALASRFPRRSPRFLRRLALLVPTALQHRQRRVAGEARIRVGAAAPEEGGAAPVGDRANPSAGETKTDVKHAPGPARAASAAAAGASPRRTST